MRYKVEFTASALREYQALDRQVQRRISTKISELAENPFQAGVKKFHGEANHWRLRMVDYRIIYRVEKHRVVIVVVRVGHRREVYR